MEFGLLGPFEARAAGRLVDVGPPLQRCVLAVLAADASRPVPVDTLTDRVWGPDLPRRPRQTLYVYIARLRRLLEGLGVEVTRHSGGYLLDVEPHQVDVHRFRDLVRRAGEAGCAPASQVALMRQALGLWRGPALADLPGQWAARTRDGWQHDHLAAVIGWASAELASGDAGAAAGPLAELTEQHPLNEALAAVSMRVLAATGRAADALGLFRRIRDRLVAELGVDPGAELQDTHRMILRGSPMPAAAPAGRAVPAQAPADVAAFTGRRTELAVLDTFLLPEVTGTESGEPRTTVPIVVVSGTAGVGKTALMVRWAQRSRSLFPDGTLYVNLRGYDPERPVPAGEALVRFLGVLGVAPTEIPADADDRAARYRTETADLRMLILLDNASAVEQVRPLLPGAAGCAVLVSSRDSLAGLIAVHGAHRLDLGTLPPGEAETLLRRLIGVRAQAEPDAVTALANRCVHLPLALRIAAELAGSRPEETLADLAGGLDDEQRRLSLLDAGGDPRAAVTAVFSWSLRHLPPAALRLFRLLGLHPGPDVDRFAAAALTGSSVDAAMDGLELLVRSHLLHRTAPGRYGMHDLLRAYASGLVADDVAADAASARLSGYYSSAAGAAMNALHPSSAHYRPIVTAPDTAVPDLDDAQAARRWLDAERACLVATAEHGAVRGEPEHAIRLSRILARYLAAGHPLEAFTVHERARQAAEQIGDRAAMAHALLGIGQSHMQRGAYGPAQEHQERARQLARLAGDVVGQSLALLGLGSTAWMQASYEPAARHFRAALRSARRAGDRLGEATALDYLGMVADRLGQPRQAMLRHRQALSIFAEIGDQAGESVTLNNLGIAEQRLGKLGPANEHLTRSLALFRLLGNRRGEAYALDSLATVQMAMGHHRQAAAHLRAALELFVQVGDRLGEAYALNGLGEAARHAGDTVGAIEWHRAARRVAVDTRAADQQARACLGLGHLGRAAADLVGAREHFECALSLYRQMGSSDADGVLALLDALGPDP